MSWELCSTDAIVNVEITKVIKASGNYKYACSSTDIELIEVESFEALETCLPDISEINGSFPLHNQWMIQYIQTPGTLVFPPCEGYSNINFYTQENIMAGNSSFNWFHSTYSITDEITIQIETLALSLGIGTNAQAYFEKKLLEVLDSKALMQGNKPKITYLIDNNFLTLENTSKNSLIKLYLKP
ncbi:MAG: hypothetical protein KF845_04715 [Cyclobacteriaceae bacterium]|nr:hypothetical protein [Cyclobacteriaceae bacterium]